MIHKSYLHRPDPPDGVAGVMPAFDLIGGRVVRLRQGDYAREKVFEGDGELRDLYKALHEEKAAAEQIENDRIAEENRVKELKAKCEKKGLSFDEEEAKYQAKLAAKKAKEDAKAAKRAKNG